MEKTDNETLTMRLFNVYKLKRLSEWINIHIKLIEDFNLFRFDVTLEDDYYQVRWFKQTVDKRLTEIPFDDDYILLHQNKMVFYNWHEGLKGLQLKVLQVVLEMDIESQSKIFKTKELNTILDKRRYLLF